MDIYDIKAEAILITTINDGTSVRPLKTIEYKGKFWLVPQWLQTKDGQSLRPARIISLENFQVQDLRGRGSRFDFAIGLPIPKALLGDFVPPELAAQYVMEEAPLIRIQSKSTLH